MNCRLPAAHRQTASGHARRALFCGVAATSAPCSSNQCFSHATEENPLSARNASSPSEVSRNSPMGRSSELASGQPEGSNCPFWSDRERYLEAVDPFGLGNAPAEGGLSS